MRSSRAARIATFMSWTARSPTFDRTKRDRSWLARKSVLRSLRKTGEAGMFAYHLRLGLKSLRRNPVLTALMISAIGLGIAVCLTTLNVYSLVSGNPLAARNEI